MIYDMCVGDSSPVELVKGKPLDVDTRGTISTTITNGP